MCHMTSSCKLVVKTHPIHLLVTEIKQGVEVLKSQSRLYFRNRVTWLLGTFKHLRGRWHDGRVSFEAQLLHLAFIF